MKPYQIHQPDSFQSMPWRNGLGHTIELLSAQLPQSNAFCWRISMADVVNNGEFSDFSGYDRTLLLLEGKGMTLDYGNGGSDNLSENLQTAHFKGDEKTIATLHDGPIKDFNIMSQRDYCSTTTTVLKDVHNQEINIDSDILLIYAPEQAIQINTEQQEVITVASKHLLQLNEPGDKKWTVSGSALIVIQIHYKNS